MSDLQSAAQPTSISHVRIVAKAAAETGGKLAISGKGFQNVCVYAADDGDAYQLWQRLPTADGAYMLINKANGLCILRNGNTNGAQLVLALPGENWAPSLAQWRDDVVKGDYNAINSLDDWEQKINIPGDGPYYPGNYLVTWTWSHGADNELWQQVPVHAENLTLQSLSFDVAHAAIEKTPSQVLGNIYLYNPSRFAPQMISQSQGFSVPLSYGFTAQGAYRDATFVYQGQTPWLDPNGNLVMIGSFPRYAPTVSTTTGLTVSVQAYVQANGEVTAEVSQLCARLSVPFTAVFTAGPPGGGTQTVTMTGTYKASGTYGYAYRTV